MASALEVALRRLSAQLDVGDLEGVDSACIGISNVLMGRNREVCLESSTCVLLLKTLSTLSLFLEDRNSVSVTILAALHFVVKALVGNLEKNIDEDSVIRLLTNRLICFFLSVTKHHECEFGVVVVSTVSGNLNLLFSCSETLSVLLTTSRGVELSLVEKLISEVWRIFSGTNKCFTSQYSVFKGAIGRLLWQLIAQRGVLSSMKARQEEVIGMWNNLKGSATIPSTLTSLDQHGEFVLLVHSAILLCKMQLTEVDGVAEVLIGVLLKSDTVDGHMKNSPLPVSAADKNDAAPSSSVSSVTTNGSNRKRRRRKHNDGDSELMPNEKVVQESWIKNNEKDLLDSRMEQSEALESDVLGCLCGLFESTEEVEDDADHVVVDSLCLELLAHKEFIESIIRKTTESMESTSSVTFLRIELLTNLARTEMLVGEEIESQSIFGKIVNAKWVVDNPLSWLNNHFLHIRSGAQETTDLLEALFSLAQDCLWLAIHQKPETIQLLREAMEMTNENGRRVLDKLKAEQFILKLNFDYV